RSDRDRALSARQARQGRGAAGARRRRSRAATRARDRMGGGDRVRSSRSPEGRIVRAHISQKDSVLDLLEREADGVGGPALPNPSRPLDALDAERRVCWISFVQSQCLRESFSVLSREFLGGPFETSCPLEDHRFKSEISALAERNRFTRRRRISSCASRSPRCHSSVQKYACDASTRLFLRRTISSGVRTSATNTSPSDARIRRRTSEGRVIWPLRRRVRTSE